MFKISPYEKYWDAIYALDWGISFDEDRVQLIADTLGVKSVAIENFCNTWIYTYGVSQMAQELVQKLCDDVIGGFPAMFNSMRELVSTISSGNIKANSSKIKVIVINFSISLLTFIRDKARSCSDIIAPFIKDEILSKLDSLGAGPTNAKDRKMSTPFVMKDKHD